MVTPAGFVSATYFFTTDAWSSNRTVSAEGPAKASAATVPWVSPGYQYVASASPAPAVAR